MTQLGYGGDDPTNIGSQTTDLVGFYGKTPVAKQSAVTTLATTPTATDIATAVNAIINRLQTVGLIA